MNEEDNGVKKLAAILIIGVSVFLVACGGPEKTESSSEDSIVSEVSKALETVQETESVKSVDQEISDKLFEISNWLTMDVWNDGFCDLSHYIGRGTNSVGEDLDLEYTLHKLDNAMEKKEEYNEFITGLEDSDRYKELKYIWVEKLYPEMESLYGIIEEKKPEPNDTTSLFNASNFSTYDSDFKDEIHKIREDIASETETQ